MNNKITWLDDRDTMRVIAEKIGSKQAKIADMLSDMILFHKTVKENGATMNAEWDDNE